MSGAGSPNVGVIRLASLRTVFSSIRVIRAVRGPKLLNSSGLVIKGLTFSLRLPPSHPPLLGRQPRQAHATRTHCPLRPWWLSYLYGPRPVKSDGIPRAIPLDAAGPMAGLGERPPTQSGPHSAAVPLGSCKGPRAGFFSANRVCLWRRPLIIWLEASFSQAPSMLINPSSEKLRLFTGVAAVAVISSSLERSLEKTLSPNLPEPRITHVFGDWAVIRPDERLPLPCTASPAGKARSSRPRCCPPRAAYCVAGPPRCRSGYR